MTTPTTATSPSSRPNAAWEVRLALVLIGFTAVIAQVVLMRELIVVAYGNEVSLGLMLASWLLWTAFGSGVLGRLSTRVRHPRWLLATLEISAALALPATIYAVRASRYWLHALPGETLGPGAVLGICAVALSVFCALSGSLFAAGVRLHALELGSSAATAAGSVYLLESLGSGAGGILASLLLVRYVGAFQAAMLVGGLNLLMAASLLTSRRKTLPVAALLCAAVLFAAAPRLERRSLQRLWHGLDLVASRNSEYGNLAVIATGETRSLYENGLVLFNVPDAAAAEETVHYALLQHPAPRSVLLIGGGMNGSLREAFQHPTLERADYVELDPLVLTLGRSYFPAEWTAMAHDPRIHVHYGDGRLFLKHAPASSYDVIIVNLPEPQTAQLNRFYTREFFAEARQRLRPGGLLALELRSSENYVSPERAEFLRCIYRTLREVFPEVGFIPGESIHFFAGDPGRAIPEATQLIARLRERHLDTRYVREYFLPFRMMPDRMAEMNQVLRASAATRVPSARHDADPERSEGKGSGARGWTPINYDFAPIAYYFDVALWSTQFNRAYQGIFQTIAAVSFARALFAALAAGVALTLMLLLAMRRHRAGAAASVAATGFTLIALEILLLLGFQAIYGYVYQQIAVVIAAFMCGMALGGWMVLNPSARKSRALGTPTRASGSTRALALLQMVVAIAPLVLVAMLTAMARSRGLDAVAPLAFPLLALAAGLLGGAQFLIANRTFAGGKDTASAGLLYALDLAGACLGAILVSLWLVPVYGFARAAGIIAAANAGPALLVCAAAYRRPAHP